MAKLKKYSSFAAMKSGEELNDTVQPNDAAFAEFEDLVKRLQRNYANRQEKKKGCGK